MNDEQILIDEAELHAYVDGALPETRRTEIAALLAKHPELAARVHDYAALNALFHERYDGVSDEPVPKRLLAAVKPDTMRGAMNWPRFAALAATLVIGIAIGAAIDAGLRGTREGAFPLAGNPGSHAVDAQAGIGFARQAAVAHVVYMPAVDRPANAAEHDERQFMLWLTDRLGTNIHPPLLSRAGFELTGGRLLPGADGPTALFMYRDQQGERVTLSVAHRKTSANTTAFRLFRDGPVNVFYWVDGDFGYAVSGGIDRKVLLGVAREVHTQLAEAGSQ